MIRVSGESKSRLVKAAGAESCGQRRNQKLHAVVARSTFSSQNAKKLTVSDHFLKFRGSLARSTFSSQNAKKTDGLRPLFEVQMLQNCAPLWREAHFEAKMLKNRHSQSTF